jgi:Putative peptidoglycan binding domain
LGIAGALSFEVYCLYGPGCKGQRTKEKSSYLKLPISTCWVDTGSIIGALSTSHFKLTARSARLTKGKRKMKKLLSLTVLILCLFTSGVFAQDAASSSSAKSTSKQTKRGPVFRATKEQINQAQALLKSRGFYSGEQIGKLDDATREGLRKYQQAEGLKITGTLNKLTLEKMNIALTEKQKAM